MSEFSRIDPGRFSLPLVWEIKIPIEGHGPQHNGILANFVSAILDGTPLIAPAQEGLSRLIRSLATLEFILSRRPRFLLSEGLLGQESCEPASIILPINHRSPS
jgi:hypothetical protein